MPTSDSASALATEIITELQVLVTRLATLRAEVNVLSNLAQGVAMKVANALPAPEAPAGTLAAEVAVGPAPEEAS